MINAIEKEVAQKAVISFSSDSADGSTLIKNVNNSDGEITIKGLSFAYPKSDHYLFKSLNLEFSPGEAISLLGPSGCGKSSLLHLMAGLNFPSKGSVSVNGKTVSGPSSKVNLMLQKATLYPWLTVFQNASFGLKVQKLNKKSIADTVLPLLELVKLDHLANRNVRQLSGGQQQRVALARSLSTNPSVMLLDEPFSALDTFTRIELQNEIRQICKRKGITLVIVTHDFDEAIRMSDRIFMMTNKVGGDIVSEIDNQPTFTAESPEEAIALQRSHITSLWHQHMDTNVTN
jgi:NitT/TauT family transport system ATP-binding protein